MDGPRSKPARVEECLQHIAQVEEEHRTVLDILSRNLATIKFHPAQYKLDPKAQATTDIFALHADMVVMTGLHEKLHPKLENIESLVECFADTELTSTYLQYGTSLKSRMEELQSHAKKHKAFAQLMHQDLSTNLSQDAELNSLLEIYGDKVPAKSLMALFYRPIWHIGRVTALWAQLNKIWEESGKTKEKITKVAHKLEILHAHLSSVVAAAMLPRSPSSLKGFFGFRKSIKTEELRKGKPDGKKFNPLSPHRDGRQFSIEDDDSEERASERASGVLKLGSPRGDKEGRLEPPGPLPPPTPRLQRLEKQRGTLWDADPNGNVPELKRLATTRSIGPAKIPLPRPPSERNLFRRTTVGGMFISSSKPPALPQRTGWLRKLGTKTTALNGWQKRWFEMHDDNLYYYKVTGASKSAAPQEGDQKKLAGVIRMAKGVKILDLTRIRPRPYREPTKKCDKCGVFFGALKNKYRCDGCGLHFCDKCTPYLLPLIKFGSCVPNRVCIDCQPKAVQDLQDAHVSAASYDKKVVASKREFVLPSSTRAHMIGLMTADKVLWICAKTRQDAVDWLEVFEDINQRLHRKILNDGRIMFQPDKWEINYSDIVIQDKVGEGAFGAVFRGRLWGVTVAVKSLHMNKFEKEQVESDLKKEAKILSTLRHPNVVLYFGAATKWPDLAIVTEWCGKGSLNNLLADHTVHISAKMMVHVAMGIAQGMNYLHNLDQKIIHRDLKSANILIDKDWNVKVADFGLSTLQENAKTEIVGTPEWIAPEVLDGKAFDEKSDVYSFGILLSEILTRAPPFKDQYEIGCIDDVVDIVLDDGAMPTIPEWAEDFLKPLVLMCLSRTPGSRPSFSHIVSILNELISLDDPEFWTLFDIPRLLELITSSAPLDQALGASEFAALCKQADFSLTKVDEFLESLSALLSSSVSAVQLQSCMAITALLSLVPALHCRALVERGAIPSLVAIVLNPNTADLAGVASKLLVQIVSATSETREGRKLLGGLDPDSLAVLADVMAEHIQSENAQMKKQIQELGRKKDILGSLQEHCRPMNEKKLTELTARKARARQQLEKAGLSNAEAEAAALEYGDACRELAAVTELLDVSRTPAGGISPLSADGQKSFFGKRSVNASSPTLQTEVSLKLPVDVPSEPIEAFEEFLQTTTLTYDSGDLDVPQDAEDVPEDVEEGEEEDRGPHQEDDGSDSMEMFESDEEDEKEPPPRIGIEESSHTLAPSPSPPAPVLHASPTSPAPLLLKSAEPRLPPTLTLTPRTLSSPAFATTFPTAHPGRKSSRAEGLRREVSEEDVSGALKFALASSLSLISRAAALPTSGVAAEAKHHLIALRERHTGEIRIDGQTASVGYAILYESRLLEWPSVFLVLSKRLLLVFDTLETDQGGVMMGGRPRTKIDLGERNAVSVFSAIIATKAADPLVLNRTRSVSALRSSGAVAYLPCLVVDNKKDTWCFCFESEEIRQTWRKHIIGER